MRFTSLALAACLAAGVSNTCLAQELQGTPRFTDTQVGFAPGAAHSNYTLTISGPNGFHASASAPREAPTIDLRRFGRLDDGVYHYELTAMSSEKVAVRTPIDNGRAGGPTDTTFKSLSTSGVIHVKDGTIVKFDPAAREPEKVKRPPAERK